MYTSRKALALMFLAAPLAFGQQGSSSATLPKPNERSTLCKPASLPPDVQGRLKGDFGSWKVQEPADLSARARERWESEKPLACPGIAAGEFENAKTPSYAVLLVPREHTDAAGYKFLVFSPQAGQQSYRMRTADFGDSGGANFFIHQAPIRKFFSEPSRKKFQAHTRDGILLVDSAENEYGVEVYFWSGNRYRHEPVDY
jgi:hypothetical protein